MMHETLNQYRIKDVPSSMFYMPNFLTDEEEKYILNKVLQDPYSQHPQEHRLILSHRSRQISGSPSPTVACKPFLPK